MLSCDDDSVSITHMTPAPTDAPVLRHFRVELDKVYGPRIDRVVLFGSRARGDARADSDYDILKDLPDVWRERRRLANMRVDFIDESGACFDAKPYSMTAWQDRTPLMHEIRRDGIEL